MIPHDHSIGRYFLPTEGTLRRMENVMICMDNAPKRVFGLEVMRI